jgi:hypothetical protein
MPLLSNKANIEYGPNSIFGISKKMQTIALKNLENSAENPDIAQSKRPVDLKQFYEEFLSELVGISSQFSGLKGTVITLINDISRFANTPWDELPADQIEAWEKWEDVGDVRGLINRIANERFNVKKLELGRTKPTGTKRNITIADVKPKIGEAFSGQSRRTKKQYPEDFLQGSGISKKIVGKYNPRFTDRFTGRPEPHSWLVADVNGEQMTGGKKRRGRKSARDEEFEGGGGGVKVYPAPEDLESSSDEEANSIWGTVGNNSSYRGRAGGDPDSDPEDSDSSSSSSDSESNFSSNPSELADPDNDDAESHVEDEMANWPALVQQIRDEGISNNPMLYLITKIISLISKANILFNGRIKKNINYFDRLDVQDMAEKVEKLVEQSNNSGLDVVNLYLDNGPELVDALTNALNKLYLDVSIAVKSYAPSAQSGGSISGGSLRKMGFQEFYKNCPTKYLL